MLALQLALIFAHNADAASGAPNISDLMLSSTPGNVSTGLEATLTLQWQSYNLNDVDYDIKIYRDNVLMQTIEPSAGSWTNVIRGFAEVHSFAGASSRVVFDWQFRVELVRASGEIITLLGAPWRGVYQMVGFVTGL